MFCRILLLILISTSATVAQDALGNRPDECQRDQNFCMNFCLTTNKETVWAQCGKDKASCICTDQYHRSVKVRFIEERSPVPPTTPAPVRPVQYVNSEPVNPSYTAGQVPELLVCDASEPATTICNHFCITNIGASNGLCNITDLTCLCQGVSPAVVQNVPIPAIFNGQLPPPTTPRPPPPQQNFWTPITPNHPNYNPNSISNGYYPNQPQPQSQQILQQYSPYRPPEPHYYPGNGQPYQAQHNQYQIPSEQIVGQGITMSQSISENAPNPDTLVNPVNQQQPLPEALEHPRQRRSAGSSYASVHSFGQALGREQTNQRSCSIYSCEDACTRSQYNMPRCTPKCLDNECVCLCKPPNYGDMIQDIQEAMIMQGMEEGMRPFGNANPRPMTPARPHGNTMDSFAPPPSFY